MMVQNVKVKVNFGMATYEYRGLKDFKSLQSSVEEFAKGLSLVDNTAAVYYSLTPPGLSGFASKGNVHPEDKCPVLRIGYLDADKCTHMKALDEQLKRLLSKSLLGHIRELKS